MTAYTPGPWKLETESRSEDGSDLLVTTPDGAWNIADCRDHTGLGVDDVEQAEANTRLIAAAPEMHAAIEHAIREIEGLTPESLKHGGAVPITDLLRAALAKAVSE